MFKKLEYVYMLYKEQSFTRAAERLFISQPSLSAAIKSVEAEVGAPLFDRAGNKITLTEIGREYIAAAEKMMRIKDEFESRVNDIYNLESGSLSVGGTNYLASYILPGIINSFALKHPKIDVTLVEANSSNLGRMMRNEELDIIIDSFDGEDDAYQRYPLSSERILLCVPATMDINRALREYAISPEVIYNQENITAPTVPIEKFKNESFVLLKSGNDMHDHAMKILGNAGIEPRVSFFVDQLNISFALADSGMGVCFITDTIFKYGNYRKNVVLYNLGNEHRTLYVAHKKNRYCTTAMKKFIELARRMLIN